MSATNVPVATKPRASAPRRAGRGWTVKIAETAEVTTDQGIYGDHYWTVKDGEILLAWKGTNGVMHCTESTWQMIEQLDGAITAMQESQQEAKAAMPKAVVRDVALAAHLAGERFVAREVHDPRKPKKKGTNGIVELRSQITALVEDMARFPDPSEIQQAEFARRYGRYRDQMKDLRVQFTHAEGAFEVAQARLLAFMDD